MTARFLAYASFMVIGAFISSAAQVMLKKAAMKEYSSPIREYLNPIVIIAYIVFFGASFLSIIAYKVVPLSLGAILEATSYIYVTIFGVALFNETITKKRMIALVLIITGIVIYAAE